MDQEKKIEKSSPPQEDRARGEGHSRKWETTTTALSAVFGALVGGLLSFAGTYVTSENQAERSDFEIRRTAYVGFFEKTAAYRSALINLDDMSPETTEAEFEEIYDEYTNAATEHYGAMTNVALVTELGDHAARIYGEYSSFDNGIRKKEDLNIEWLKGSVYRGDQELISMLAEAQKDIRGEISSEFIPLSESIAPIDESNPRPRPPSPSS